MDLHELLAALHDELEAAGLSSEGASASLAFVAKKDRNGEIKVDFVDSGAMSKPRPEELHRLELSLSDRPQVSSSAEKQSVAAPVASPPSLPPKRT